MSQLSKEEYELFSKEIEGLTKLSLERLFAEALRRQDLEVAYRADRLLREKFPKEQPWDVIMERWDKLGKLRRARSENQEEA